MTNPIEEVRDQVTPEATEQATQTEAQPEAPKVEPQAEPEKLSFTQAEIDAMIIREKNKVKSKFGDYDELKTKLSTYEETEKARKEAEMSELERYQAQLAEKDEQAQAYAKQLEEIKAQYEREKIQGAFTQAAVGANVAYLDDALRLADLSNVRFEDGKVVGVDEVVADLVQNKPFLLKSIPQPIGSATQHQEPKAEKTAEKQLDELKEVYKKSGKAEDMAKYISFKREHGL
jgi:hypothetical protein